jgi:hypothetical protein
MGYFDIIIFGLIINVISLIIFAIVFSFHIKNRSFLEMKIKEKERLEEELKKIDKYYSLKKSIIILMPFSLVLELSITYFNILIWLKQNPSKDILDYFIEDLKNKILNSQ